MPEPRKISLPNNQFLRIIFLIVAVIAIWIFPHHLIFDPDRTLCLHKYLLGYQCPLCGMTRAVYQITHFRVASAISYNAVVVLLPFYFVADVGSFFSGKNWLVRARKIIMILIFIGLALLYLYRMAMHFHWI